MLRKLISITLTFILIVSIFVPVTAASKNSISCSSDNVNSKVTISWDFDQGITVKITRDNTEYKTFTNTQTGNFSVVETEAGNHSYKASAIRGSNTTYSSCNVVGTGKPVINLEFINDYTPEESKKPQERIKDWVKIKNLGSTALDLNKFIIRYFYTVDGEPSAAKDNPNNGQAKAEASDQRINPTYSFTDNQKTDVLVAKEYVNTTFTKMPVPVPKADYYCDTYFTTTNISISSVYDLKIQPAFRKINLTDTETNHTDVKNYIRMYDLTNDYSFNNSENIAVYYDGELIWGNDPSIIAPSNLTAKTDVGGIKLNWSPCAGADSYNIWRSSTKDENYAIIKNIKAFDSVTNTDVKSFLDDSIDSPSADNYTGKEYFYKINAVYNTSQTGFSNIASATIYPYVKTALGTLSYRILSKKDNTTFTLGSYIPIVFELKLNDKTTNPNISLTSKAVNSPSLPSLLVSLATELVIKNTNTNGVNLLRAKINNGSILELKYGSSAPQSTISYYIHKMNDTVIYRSIIFNGIYEKDDVLKVEFVAMLKADNAAIDNDIKKYYGDTFNLNFILKGTRSGQSISTAVDPTKTPIKLPVKIVKSEKVK